MLHQIAQQPDNQRHAGTYAQRKRDNSGQRRKIKAHHCAHRSDYRQIQPHDQQQRRTGNPRQHHGGNGHKAAKKHINKAPHTAHRAAGHRMNGGHYHHKDDTRQNKGRPFPAPSQRHFFLMQYQWDGKQDKADKYGTDSINMAFKHTAQRQDRQAHANHPAKPQLDQEFQRRTPALSASVDQVVQRRKKAVVKSQQKGDRTAGNTGHTVGQRHTESPEHVDENQICVLLFLPKQRLLAALRTL